MLARARGVNSRGEAHLRLLLQQAKQGAHVHERLLRFPVHRAKEVQWHGHLQRRQ